MFQFFFLNDGAFGRRSSSRAEGAGRARNLHGIYDARGICTEFATPTERARNSRRARKEHGIREPHGIGTEPARNCTECDAHQMYEIILSSRQRFRATRALGVARNCTELKRQHGIARNSKASTELHGI